MNSIDTRFDDAESELRRGDAWRYREAGAPNPLTIQVTGWSSGHTKHGEAEFLNGVDREGNPWSVLVGSMVLKRRLIDGEVSEWDDERGAYVVTSSQGRAEAGEVVSIKYLGDRESASGKPYADFKVVRKPFVGVPTDVVDEGAGESAADDDIPF
jgi:hypothetical protein